VFVFTNNFYSLPRTCNFEQACKRDDDCVGGRTFYIGFGYGNQRGQNDSLACIFHLFLGGDCWGNPNIRGKSNSHKEVKRHNQR
jgi:hypothetical protein